VTDSHCDAHSESDPEARNGYRKSQRRTKKRARRERDNIGPLKVSMPLASTATVTVSSPMARRRRPTRGHKNIKRPSAYPTLDHVKDPLDLYNPEHDTIYEDQRSIESKSPDAFIYDQVAKSFQSDSGRDTSTDSKFEAADLLLFCAKLTTNGLPKPQAEPIRNNNNNDNNNTNEDYHNNNNNDNNNHTSDDDSNNDINYSTGDSGIWDKLINDERLLRAFHKPWQYYRYLMPFKLIIKETADEKKGAGLFTSEVIIIHCQLINTINTYSEYAVG
jgi:hypothetical protein